MFEGKNYNAGLWSVCFKDDEECLSYDEWLQGEDIPSWLKQTRILSDAIHLFRSTRRRLCYILGKEILP